MGWDGCIWRFPTSMKADGWVVFPWVLAGYVAYGEGMMAHTGPRGGRGGTSAVLCALRRAIDYRFEGGKDDGEEECKNSVPSPHSP